MLQVAVKAGLQGVQAAARVLLSQAPCAALRQAGQRRSYHRGRGRAAAFVWLQGLCCCLSQLTVACCRCLWHGLVCPHMAVAIGRSAELTWACARGGLRGGVQHCTHIVPSLSSNCTLLSLSIVCYRESCCLYRLLPLALDSGTSLIRNVCRCSRLDSELLGCGLLPGCSSVEVWLVASLLFACWLHAVVPRPPAFRRESGFFQGPLDWLHVFIEQQPLLCAVCAQSPLCLYFSGFVCVHSTSIYAAPCGIGPSWP